VESKTWLQVVEWGTIINLFTEHLLYLRDLSYTTYTQQPCKVRTNYSRFKDELKLHGGVTCQDVTWTVMRRAEVCADSLEPVILCLPVASTASPLPS
jgi:hypothetical protein